MATAGETSLLSQILEQLSRISADVSEVKGTTGRLDERVKTTVEASIDHEARLREVEKTYVTQAELAAAASAAADEAKAAAARRNRKVVLIATAAVALLTPVEAALAVYWIHPLG